MTFRHLRLFHHLRLIYPFLLVVCACVRRAAPSCREQCRWCVNGNLSRVTTCGISPNQSDNTTVTAGARDTEETHETVREHRQSHHTHYIRIALTYRATVDWRKHTTNDASIIARTNSAHATRAACHTARVLHSYLLPLSCVIRVMCVMCVCVQCFTSTAPLHFIPCPFLPAAWLTCLKLE